MTQQYSNWARSKLSSGISSSSESFNVTDGTVFPIATVADGSLESGDWFKIVVTDDTNKEIMYVCTHDGNSPTFEDVRRGQEGTTPVAFDTDATVGLRITSQDALDWDNKEEILSIPTKPQAEDNANTTAFKWTPQRVWQAITKALSSLGSMATKDAGTGANEFRTNSQNDAKYLTSSSNAFMKPGDFGLGTESPPTITDMSTTTVSGFYSNNDTGSLPFDSSGDGGLLVFGPATTTPSSASGDQKQFAWSRAENLFVRGSDSADASGRPEWSGWYDISGVVEPWQVKSTSSKITWTHNGTAVMSLTSSGNLVVSGDVTIAGSP